MPLPKLPYCSRPFKDPKTGKVTEKYYPAVNVILTGNHRVGRPIEALVDSGSDINLFPADYALVHFKMNERALRKGFPKDVVGIGDKVVKAYGHRVTLKIVGADFRSKTLVYFSQEHNSLPLLGRKGFFDRFEKVSFNEHDKVLEIKPLPKR